MSISTGSIGAVVAAPITATAVDGLQRSQNAAQPVTGSGAQAGGFTGFNPAAAKVQADMPNIPAAKVATDAKEGESAQHSAEQTRQSLQDINKVLSGLSISVQFQIDPNYKDVIIQVVDQDSGKLIRQIPTGEVVRISKAMDNLKGLLFAQSA